MIDIQVSDRAKAGFIPVANPTDEVTHFRVSVTYSKGGINYFNYQNEPKGYWINVSPVKLEVKEYGSFWSTLLSKGFRHFVEEAPRFNKKKLDSLFSQLRDDVKNKTGIVTEIMNKVATSEGVAA